MKETIYSPEKIIQYREECINNFKEKFKLEELLSNLDSLKDIKTLCIGDSVIDQYVFVGTRGRASKDSILSARFISEENYAGGSLILANHISNYTNKVNLVTLIGDKNPQLGFIKKKLAKNIELKTFVKENSPTIIKKRYIDVYKGNKLFKVEYMDDKPISEELSGKVIDYLSEELPKYDLVLVLDFGHGFINDKIREVIQDKSKFLAVNSQTNSANLGYNYIDNYKRADFSTMNDVEIRFSLRMQFESINEVIEKFYNKSKWDKFLITTGKDGCIFFKENKKYKFPILTDKAVDTIGAGDAVFAITSLLVYSGLGDDRIPFFANCAGGVDVNIIGNKEAVKKTELFNFIKKIYKGSHNGMG